MLRNLKITSVVALLEDIPAYRLRRGQVGTVVEKYKSGRYEVEFADERGCTLVLATLTNEVLLPLNYGRRKRSTRAA